MLLDNLALDQDVETQGDFIPSGYTNPTGVYKCLIELAYAGKSENGAKFITVHFRQADGNMTHRETFYITKRDGTPYYVKNGKKHSLPGYEVMDNLAMLATGKRLAQLKTEDKMCNIWSWEQKKEVPQNVEVVTELMGKAVRVGLFLRESNVRRKIDGEYKPINEKRVYNEINKLFHAKGGLTAAEIQAGETGEGQFINEWTEKYPKDYIRSDYQEIAEAESIVDQASAEAASASAEENADLFA